MRRNGLDQVRAAGRQRGHHLSSGAEPCGAFEPLRLLGDLDPDGVVPLLDLVGTHADTDQRRGRSQQRIVGEVGLDVPRTPVADLRIAAGVAAEADRPQVQECRPAGGAYAVSRFGDRRPRRRRIGAVDRDVGQTRPGSVRRLHPARRRRHRDAPAVVLADQQQRYRQTAVCGIECGVDRPGRGGMVDRGIAEGADDHRVGRPLTRHSEAVGPVQSDGKPHRPGQMGGDGRGLRDDREIGMPEDLVPAAGDRLAGQRHQTLEYIPDRCRVRDLLCSRDVERSRPVVQQSGIARSQGQRHQRIAFVPRRTDRVEALTLPLQVPGDQIQMPAGRLRLEHPPPEPPLLLRLVSVSAG